MVARVSGTLVGEDPDRRGATAALRHAV